MGATSKDWFKKLNRRCLVGVQGLVNQVNITIQKATSFVLYHCSLTKILLEIDFCLDFPNFRSAQNENQLSTRKRIP